MRSTTRQLSQASLLLLSSVTLALSLYVAPIAIDLEKRGNFESGRNTAFESYLVVADTPKSHLRPIDPPSHIDDLSKRQTGSGNGRGDGFHNGPFAGKNQGRRDDEEEEEEEEEESSFDQILIKRQGNGSGRNGGFHSGPYTGKKHGRDAEEQDEESSFDEILVKHQGFDGGRNGGFAFGSTGNEDSHHRHPHSSISEKRGFESGGRDNGFAKINAGNKYGGKVHGKREDEENEYEESDELLLKRTGNDGRNNGFGHHPISFTSDSKKRGFESGGRDNGFAKINAGNKYGGKVHGKREGIIANDEEDLIFPSRRIRKDEPIKGHPPSSNQA